jgi:hypothetical protein
MGTTPGKVGEKQSGGLRGRTQEEDRARLLSQTEVTLEREK